jgi:hypothetical protein
VHVGFVGQHGLMQYCVENEQTVVPHVIVVGFPLDPPELVVPELEAPELLAPELEVVTPELLATPELDERPLDDPDEVVVCWLEA